MIPGYNTLIEVMVKEMRPDGRKFFVFRNERLENFHSVEFIISHNKNVRLKKVLKKDFLLIGSMKLSRAT